MAKVRNMATVQTTPIPVRHGDRLRERGFESLLRDLFRRAGWRIYEQDGAGSFAAMVVSLQSQKCAVIIKWSSEGRRDRLIPLLSQAVLEAQVEARRFNCASVAIVVSSYIPDSVARQVKQFGISHAPNVGLGVMDAEGFRAFHGFGLEQLNSERLPNSQHGLAVQSGSSSYPFSDLNRWMLKILIGQQIPEPLLNVPRGQYKSARQLAHAAGVSVMSASRFVRQLSSDGFLDERKGLLRLVRIRELMRQWQGATPRNLRELPACWIIPADKGQLLSAVRSYCSWLDIRELRTQKTGLGQLAVPAARIAIGLFAAADSLGLRFVHGVTPHIYLEHLNLAVLGELGLSLDLEERQPDLYIRIPENKESVFRAAVRHQGVAVCDIIQVWLDVSNHPSRGKEQADQIWKRALAPHFQEQHR
jgi:hypothetical protein